MSDEKKKIDDYTKYQIIFDGGREDAMTLYVMADSNRDADAYADLLSTRLGYNNVSITNSVTAKERAEYGDDSYAFDFPKDLAAANFVDVQDPEEEPPATILVLHPEVVEHVFDPKYAIDRMAQERKDRRAERRAMAKALVDAKD